MEKNIAQGLDKANAIGDDNPNNRYQRLGRKKMKQPPFEADAFSAWLEENNACAEARSWASGKSLPEIWQTCERGDWLEWLLNACDFTWTATARAEYQRVTAPARAEYERVTATAWTEYQRVKATARAEYERVKADTIKTHAPYPFGSISH